MGAGPTTVEIREDIRSHEIADASTDGPRILQLLVSYREGELILDRAADAAELAIRKNTCNPRMVELPIVSATNRAIPASPTLPLGDAEGAHPGDGIGGEGI